MWFTHPPSWLADRVVRALPGQKPELLDRTSVLSAEYPQKKIIPPRKRKKKSQGWGFIVSNFIY